MQPKSETPVPDYTELYPDGFLVDIGPFVELLLDQQRTEDEQNVADLQKRIAAAEEVAAREQKDQKIQAQPASEALEEKDQTRDAQYNPLHSYTPSTQINQETQPQPACKCCGLM